MKKQTKNIIIALAVLLVLGIAAAAAALAVQDLLKDRFPVFAALDSLPNQSAHRLQGNNAVKLQRCRSNRDQNSFSSDFPHDEFTS